MQVVLPDYWEYFVKGEQQYSSESSQVGHSSVRLEAMDISRAYNAKS